MLVAINRTEKNKVEGQEKFARYNGAFENVDITQTQLADEVKQGYGFCAQHARWRKKDSFTGAGFLAADVDEGLTIPEALAHEFVEQFGGFIYTSPSHTEETHRFRIVFELEEPITERQMMEHALTGLIRKLGSDGSCKDACRLFFGNTNAVVTSIGQRLTTAEVAQLVLRGQEIDVANSAPRSNGVARTVHSRQPLDPDIVVRDAKGDPHRLTDLPAQTQILCPMHLDRKSSAFTLRSKTGVPGIHCMKCQATFFVSSDGPVYDFDYSLQVFRDRPQEWSEVSYDTHPLLDPEDVALVDGVRFINERFLSPVETLADVILVKSPKGTGKTEWLKHIVTQAKNAHQSVLLIGHRQALITATAQRLRLTPYIGIQEDAQTGRSHVKAAKISEHFAICLDSLETRLEPWVHRFDIVIIDEVEQVLAHLTSDTIRPRRKQSLIYLQHYLKKAKTVYVLDADLNRVTGTSLPALIGTNTKKDCLLLVNEWTPKRGITHLYESPDHLLQVLRNEIDADRRCFVCSNSKNFVMSTMLALQEQHPGKTFYAITSDNSQTSEAQDFLLGLPNSVLTYDCVLVSPAVGTGVDITFAGGSTKIDAVFGFFEAQINTHFDIDQQLCRVRHPGCVHVWISPATYSFETDPDVIRRELMDSRRDKPELTGLSDDGRPLYAPIDELYAEVYAEIASLQRASKNDLRRNFVKLRELNGWQIVDVPLDDDARQHGREIAKRGEELSEEQRAHVICSAVELSIEKYKELKRRSEHGTLLAAENAAIRRFEIESFYYSEVTPDLVNLDADGRYQAAVRRYELIHENEGEVAKRHHSNTDLLVFDQREILERRKLLIDLFSSTGVFTENSGFNHEAIVVQQGLDPFIQTCRQNEFTIQRLLKLDLRGDLESKAATQLGQLLKLTGLRLEKAGSRKVGEQKIYLYQVSSASLEAVQEVVNRRRNRATVDDWRKMRDEDTGEISQQYFGAIERAIAEWKTKSKQPKARPPEEPDPQSELMDSLLGE